MHPRPDLQFFQLKYCERCGGLWLRPDGAVSPYCPACERFMADLPSRTRLARRKAISSVTAASSGTECTA
jgi:uncharacterized Zn finger protein (UPF0148 family)